MILQIIAYKSVRGDKIAWAHKIARRVAFARRHFGTGDFFLIFYNCFINFSKFYFFFITVTPNPYPRSVSYFYLYYPFTPSIYPRSVAFVLLFFFIILISYFFIFTITVTPSHYPWSISVSQTLSGEICARVGTERFPKM